ncbi:hypothetical protein TNCV_2187161 [Trichonephila clavipes]|nr:hypothetical protein TNCV_2187161 [Trichonephila clavipes]
MKTSSVDFQPSNPTLHQWRVNIDGLRCSEKSSSPGSGNEGKREIVLNRRPELYRGKYRCVQPKINLFSVSMDVPLRTAYSQAGRCGMQPKAKHSPARRRSYETKLKR